MTAPAIPIGVWLVDVAPGHEGRPTLQTFRVTKVYKDTVRVEEEGAPGDRVVNRMLLEGQLERGDVLDGREFLKRENAKARKGAKR